MEEQGTNGMRRKARSRTMLKEQAQEPFRWQQFPRDPFMEIYRVCKQRWAKADKEHLVANKTKPIAHWDDFTTEG